MSRKLRKKMSKRFYDHHGPVYQFSALNKYLTQLEDSFLEDDPPAEQIKKIDSLQVILVAECDQWKVILDRIAKGKQFATEKYIDDAKYQLNELSELSETIKNLREEILNQQ